MTAAPHQHADGTAAEAAQPTGKNTKRATLDLPLRTHRATKRWCAQAAVEADVDGVPMATVLRLLLGVLIDGEPTDEPLRDPELQERLHRAILRGITRVQDPDLRES